MKIIIDNIAYGGYGVGRIDGKTTFVDYALPGDELEIDIYDDKKNFSFARYTKIVTPSDKRVPSPCPNFSTCGGCTYLNLNYNDELILKKQILTDQLGRIASIELKDEIKIIHDQRFHYRSHSTIKCNGSISGFYSKASNDLISFPDSGCLILSYSLINGIKSLNFKDIKDDLKIAENHHGVFIHSNQNETILEEQTAGFRYKRDIFSFFQSNKFLRKKMIDQVIEYSELTEKDEFTDICAGCGFFTIPLSKISSHGTGFDIDKQSIQSARENAILNNSENIRFFALPEAEINPARLNPKTVIVDPPRGGISKKGRRTINAINSKIIVYVSCNPSTYSRDVADFYKNGYEIEDITLIDMFPCTHHIEIISKLVKKSEVSV